MDKDRYKPADISSGLQHELHELEGYIKETTGKDIVLVAYEKDMNDDIFA